MTDQAFPAEPLEHDPEVEVRRYEFDVSSQMEGRRLDSYLASRFPDYSRTFITILIREGCITVNGRAAKPTHCPVKGDHIVATFPARHHDEIPAEDIPIEMIYEDEWMVAVNKPPDLVVHPSRGHQTGTLVNALVHRFQKLSATGGDLRPGIVHRLDRDTTGVILIVKDDSMHELLARQFEERDVEKEYVAICEGVVELDSDVVDAPIGHDPRNRQRMVVNGRNARSAQTLYRVAERFRRFSVVRCFPKTGRTHQIRVHMLHIGHPVAADSLYSRRDAIFLSDLTGGEHAPDEEPLMPRQALHARRIKFTHPKLKRELVLEAPMPADMTRFIEALRKWDK